ncbi:MAG: diacylglycerol/lipid kinase family protein [Elusimicrobiota bacterium]
MKTYHILNPNKKNKSIVEKYWKGRRKNFSWVERTMHPTHLETLVQWCDVENIEHIVVWGGDGTFSRVLQASYSQDTLSKFSFSLVPVGTCNDLSRKVQGLDWQEVADSIEHGKISKTAFDLGLMESGAQKRVFINNAGFGRSKEAIQNKKTNALKDIFSLAEKFIRLECFENKKKIQCQMAFLMGIVFNAPYFSGGLHFSPIIEPTDGILNGYFIQAQSKFQLLKSFIKARYGDGYLTTPHMMNFSFEKMELVSENDLYFQADGEVWSFEPMHEILFSVLPQVVSAFLPETKS